MDRERGFRRLGGRRWMILMAAAGAASCSGSSPPRPAPPWEIVATELAAPAGSSDPAASLCEGSSCSEVAPGNRLRGSYDFSAHPGARVTLDLGGGAALEIAGKARLRGTEEGSPALRIEAGLMRLRAGIAAAAEEAPARRRVMLAGRWLAIDPALPSSIAIRAGEEGASVLVEKGKLTLTGEGEPLVLRAGEAARLLAGKAPERRIAAAMLPEMADAAAVGETPSDAPPAGSPRGLGTMSARVPGTSEIVTGVHLQSHKVNVVIRDGFARTEVEEIFANDTARVLEGRYVFAVPPAASVSRLALQVNEDLVEGEMVERERAAQIFQGIVDDSVRPRDPALLEWVSGSEVSLKVFPLPPHGTRRVVLAYDEIAGGSGGRGRYVYPLALGEDRAVKIDDFAIDVTASDASGSLMAVGTPGYAATIAPEGPLHLSFSAKGFTPAADFVLAYERAASPHPDVSAYASPPAVKKAAKEEPAEDGYLAMRLPVRWPEGSTPPAAVRRDRAIVVDVSQSQSKETLAGEIALAAGLVERLDPAERFVVLACDSACSSYPEDGLATASETVLADTRKWLGARVPGGSSDVAGALAEAAKRLGSEGQLVYLGDGEATAGELSAEAIAARVTPELSAHRIDLRIFGAGRTVDEVVLGGLARSLGASYERVSTGEPLGQRIEAIALGLRSPLVTGATLELPAGVHDVYPRVLPSLPVGQDLVVMGRVHAGEQGEIKLTGTLAGAPYSAARAVTWDAATTPAPVPPRLWAAAKIADLETSGDAAATKQVVALSKAEHVLSRATSLLVLENDRMFAEFGIERRSRLSGEHVDFGSGHGRLSAPPSLGEASSFGMIKLLEIDSSSSPLSADSPATSGTLMHDSGTGGLGLGIHGSGFGAGGGLGASGGFGSGASVSGGNVAPGPIVRASGVSVSGSIPPEVIQRIARTSFGRFRLCYEAGLRRNPDLSGKVSVRFQIDQRGDVTSAANGGSDLPDAGVVACVVRAFNGLAFPAPEGNGAVIVNFGLRFEPTGGRPPSPPRPVPGLDAPSATHRAGDELWTTQGEDAVEKLRRAVREGETSRARHEALIRGLITHGRFTEALTAAQRLADLDPDRVRARELLAFAAAAAGDGALSRTALDAELELKPRSADLHARAARAFEAAGDERRACAHWRSIAELRKDDADAPYEALRCRARLGDRDAVLRDVVALGKPGKRVSELATALAAGPSPAWDASKMGAGAFEAQITCESGPEQCPAVVVITPSGDVVSPWTPSSTRADAHAVSLSAVSDGTYRTLLVGGSPDARGEVTVRAFGATKKLPVTRGGLQTVAFTTVTMPVARFGG